MAETFIQYKYVRHQPDHPWWHWFFIAPGYECLICGKKHRIELIPEPPKEVLKRLEELNNATKT